MRLKPLLIFAAVTLVAGFLLIWTAFRLPGTTELDPVAVNDIVQTVAAQWPALSERSSALPNNPQPTDFSALPGTDYNLDYTALDDNGTLIAATREGLSETLNDAIRHRDTVIDVTRGGETVGKVIIYNQTEDILHEKITYLQIITIAALCTLALLGAGYTAYLNRTVIHPFRKLQGFARSVAAGNLDLPLTMDKGNLFGPFTESFDLMREELAKARENERLANQSKKELVASLSHDIKTPVASIKAIAELMLVTERSEKDRKHLETIDSKADQVDLLISNMFQATLEELQELEVTPRDESSTLLSQLIAEADYEKRVTTASIPHCMVRIDPLRLQQVLDNIISNSYKYAATPIQVHGRFNPSQDSLVIEIRDFGPGVANDELPLLSGKFYRGKNASGKSGSGLGLYIASHFLQRMGGELQCNTLPDGFVVRIILPLAG